MGIGKLGPDTTNDGGQKELPVADDDTIGLLTKLVKEMQIMNLHLQVLTDNHFTTKDI